MSFPRKTFKSLLSLTLAPRLLNRLLFSLIQQLVWGLPHATQQIPHSSFLEVVPCDFSYSPGQVCSILLWAAGVSLALSLTPSWLITYAAHSPSFPAALRPFPQASDWPLSQRPYPTHPLYGQVLGSTCTLPFPSPCRVRLHAGGREISRWDDWSVGPGPATACCILATLVWSGDSVSFKMELKVSEHRPARVVWVCIRKG